MNQTAHWQRTLDAIVSLADEIARISPDCAERAMRIVRLARAMDPPGDDASDADDHDDHDDPGVGPLRRRPPER
ncbi:hypothetical protein OPKNFCMD_3437 [Methylobacterium crusticola]|uniref:Uncharacterized protein n=1 Tax=Methylobacterium crusticola TaxID=1697972 RepID=A0ABQ4R1P0_9HYPH|nr:hypothetical protein [Methylobacterium crusticola]GJD50692.1 hypothetical protein OPKNFCMD_3437 [Methylobacterium crusticola]